MDMEALVSIESSRIIFDPSQLESGLESSNDSCTYTTSREMTHNNNDVEIYTVYCMYVDVASARLCSSSFIHLHCSCGIC